MRRQTRELGSDRLGIRFDGELLSSRKPVEEPRELGGVGERRCPAAEEDGLEPIGEDVPLEPELGKERVDVRAVLLAAADHGHEVAVPAPVRAEREVDVQVPYVTHGYFFRSESRFKTARKASCGTSTPPTCFIRFFPFFCFSSSFRLREMSPP